MITLNRKSLPLTITRNGIEHVLLSPIERIGLSAERMGISVIRVNISNDGRKVANYVEKMMYHGMVRPMWAKAKISRILEKNYYYFYDKNFVHMEKQIRHSA